MESKIKLFIIFTLGLFFFSCSTTDNILESERICNKDYHLIENVEEIVEGMICEYSDDSDFSEKDIILKKDRNGDVKYFPMTLPFYPCNLKGKWKGKISASSFEMTMDLDLLYLPHGAESQSPTIIFVPFLYDRVDNAQSIYEIKIKDSDNIYSFSEFPVMEKFLFGTEILHHYKSSELPVKYADFNFYKRTFMVSFTKMNDYSQYEDFNSMSRMKQQNCIITDENGKIYADFDRTSYRLYCYDDDFDEKQLLPCIGVYSLILRLFHEE